MADISIAGLNDLIGALKTLPDKISKKVLKGAASAGATVFKKEVTIRAPFYTGPVAKGHPPAGTLKKAIYKVYKSESSTGDHFVFKVGVLSGKGKNKTNSVGAYYAQFVEYGHRYVARGTDTITARRAAAKIANVNVVAHPFMRPAYESAKQFAAQRMKDYLRTHIAEELKALGFK